MATLIFRNAGHWFHDMDLGKESNEIILESSQELVDATNFSSTSRERRVGYQDAQVTARGFMDWTTNEAAGMFSGINFSQGVNRAVSVVGEDREQGSEETGKIAYLFQAAQPEWTFGGRTAELVGFTYRGEIGTNPALVRGRLMADRSGITTSSNTAGFQITGPDAPSATKQIYAALHVIAASGTTPTLDVTVLSDDSGAFSTPATPITFTQATQTTSEWVTAAATNDDWYRVDWTIGGTTPSFDFAVTIGFL